jgi:hypothetical protein
LSVSDDLDRERQPVQHVVDELHRRLLVELGELPRTRRRVRSSMAVNWWCLGREPASGAVNLHVQLHPVAR